MKIFKFRTWNWWRFSFYLFESRRLSLGISFDWNEWLLMNISLIFFHMEFNFMKGFQEWKHPNYLRDIDVESLVVYDFETNTFNDLNNIASIQNNLYIKHKINELKDKGITKNEELGKELHKAILGEQEIKDTKPNNLEEAIEYINPSFDGMEDYFITKDEDSFVAFCHSQLSGGIGMKIRNGFEFWSNKNSNLYLDLKENHNCNHPDDMSAIIIRGVYKLRKNGTTTSK